MSERERQRERELVCVVYMGVEKNEWVSEKENDKRAHLS